MKATSSNAAGPAWAARPVSLAAANDSLSSSVSYYESDRAEMIAFLPSEPGRLLDVGCGEGLFGQAVKKRFPRCETWGIELVAKVAEKAASRNDRVLNVPLEQSGISAEYFDVVTMNDVLEHITWPGSMLAEVQRVLKPDGTLVISLPNVQFLLNVLNLVLRNDWQYQDSGILDHTHMRFYTAKSASRLVEEAGFRVEKIVGINPMRPKWYYRVLFALVPRFRWMTFYQFAIVARPQK